MKFMEVLLTECVGVLACDMATIFHTQSSPTGRAPFRHLQLSASDVAMLMRPL